MKAEGGSSAAWVAVVSCENLPGCPRPPEALRARLRDRGVDWMPFAGDLVCFDLLCGVGADGHWRGQYVVRVHADALRVLGPHSDQPSATVTGPFPPRWWHATAEHDVGRGLGY